ncbi:TPA: PTS lactose/cellobiose transporter subunit IIA [Enterobacter hormaechei subsp. xiangfangensis]
MHAARQGNLDEAKSLLREADGYARQAHKMQTKLIEQDAGEARQPMTLIMVHAQDHLMNSLLARELSEEIIHLYQR